MPSTTWFWVLTPLAAALFLGSPLSAAAQEQSEEGDSGRDEEARSLFEAGDTAYAEGRFESALEYFERSYELSGRPELLFNIGSAADRLRDNDRALDAFRQYLTDASNIDNRGQVEARIRILEAQPAATPATAAPPTETTAPIEPGPPIEAGDAGAGPWVLAGAGVAVMIAGGVFLGVALDDKGTVENANGPVAYSPTFEDAANRVPVFSTIGWIGLGVGAALLTSGFVWLALGGDQESGATARLLIGPSGITMGGEF